MSASRSPETVLFLHRDPLTLDKRSSWLKRTARSLVAKMQDKFIIGQLEHKCDIGEQTTEYLLEAIEQEAIDQLTYVRELKRRYLEQKQTTQEEIK